MCLGVYIASDCALPTVEWDPARPAFCVGVDAKYTCAIRGYFSKPFVYAAGCHMGCGCGFTDYDRSYDEQGEFGEDGEPDGRKSRRGLAEFLSAALQHQAAVEVFVFINNGVAPEPPKRRRQARPADFLRDRTLFDSGQLVVVSEQDAPSREDN